MHIVLNSGCQTILIKSVQTFVAVVWGATKPLANIQHSKVYGCYLIGLPTGEKKREKKKGRKKTERVQR